jgi:hypothetical protein
MRRLPLVSALLVVVLSVVATACEGTWTRAANPSPVRAVHAALMHTGKVLLIAGSGNDPTNFAAGTFRTAVYDPATDTFDTNITTPYDLFCSGHAFLPDGRLLVAGGTAAYQTGTHQWYGEKRATLFDPATQTYQTVPNMAIGRWYPSVAETGDGNLVALAGYDDRGNLSNTFQVFDPTKGTWSADRGIGNDTAGVYSPLYPSFHLLADGRLFYSGNHAFDEGTGTLPFLWNVGTNQASWIDNNAAINADTRDQGASVLLPPAQAQKVMVIGGSGTASTAVIDLSKANPTYVAGPPIDAGKQYVSAVILPDGRVLQTGGATAARDVPGVQYVHSTQILDPKTMTWTKVADQQTDRSYHSGALLLPDGRVLAFGGNPIDGSFQMAIDIYSPGYMTKTRPKITTAPTSATWGTGFTVKASTPISSAVLIRPSATTHSSDTEQRSVDLAVSGTTLTIPANHNLTPPGWYMLFVRDAAGVPSVASWVKVG